MERRLGVAQSRPRNATERKGWGSAPPPSQALVWLSLHPDRQNRNLKRHTPQPRRSQLGGDLQIGETSWSGLRTSPQNRKGFPRQPISRESSSLVQQRSA